MAGGGRGLVRARSYVERPVAVWFAVFDGETPVDYRVPWPIPKGKTLRRCDLDDFPIRLDLAGDLHFYGQGPDDGGSPSVFVPAAEAGPIDAPVYIPGRKLLGDLPIPPCLRPGDVFLPLMEGKWIYHHDHARYAYVSGSGSWVVTRPTDADESDLISHYFLARLDAETRTPEVGDDKIGFRDVCKSATSGH